MLNIFSYACLPLIHFCKEVSAKVFCPFLKWVVCFFLLCLKSSLDILDESPSLDGSFASIFSHSVVC